MHTRLALTVVVPTLLASLAAADTVTNEPAAAPAAPPVIVTARKWTEPLHAVPGAVTVVPAADLAATGAQDLRDAARGVPNLTLGDFSERRLHFPFMRGIGSGRNTPAVTTCIDGVPQLSYATANQALLDVDRIEFLRGAQGALYGRNALGGAIDVVPRPPTNAPGAAFELTAGDYDRRAARASAEGPLGPGRAAAGVAVGYAARDGYTRNDLTGHRLDDREALFGRGQLAWPDLGRWSLRFSVSGERDRDGDYTLTDLAALRGAPHRASRDDEGRSDRDLAQPVFTARRRGARADFTSITAFQWWRSEDRTDLDATAMDLMRRANAERQAAWIEELRLSSPEDAPVPLGARADLRWLLGAFAFRSDYGQSAATEYRAASAVLFGLPMAYRQHDDATLDDNGASVFGQGTVTLDERLELGVGLRHDYERRAADLRGYSDPALMPPAATTAARDFNQTTPRATIGCRLAPGMLAYVAAARGYKSGGFNPRAPAGQTAYDEETSWTYETGLKTAWLRQRVVADVALFHIAWDDLQLDTPAGPPGQYYIGNAGQAWSQGIEAELTVRPAAGLDLFGGVGLLDAGFRSGSTSAGADVGGRDLPFAPPVTWHAGTAYAHDIGRGRRAFARLDGVGTGRYYYEASNAAAQSPHALVHVRLGVTRGAWRVEGWVNNAFDEDYVPIAFPYPLAPSGYVGESGAPRTIGVTLAKAF